MIEPKTIDTLRAEVDQCIRADRGVLEQLRTDVRPLRSQVRRIRPYLTTSISLVGTDGGNNQVQFDPFLVQVIRVVDSNNNEYCLEVVSPRTPIDSLSSRHLDVEMTPKTPLGRMMRDLGIASLYDLSGAIPKPPREPSPSWIQVYRELTEWATLYQLICEKDFASDTVIVCDGLLRSKVFSGYLFTKGLKARLEQAILKQYQQNRRRILIAGVAKHSRVLQTYRLAMALEGVLRTSYPAYVEVPRQLETNVYQWSEYARGDDQELTGREGNKFVAGKMFFVKFGDRPHDPIWPIDLLDSQASSAATTLGYMLGDALGGFPVPFYPQCLQKAHENAALTDFDMEILEDQIKNTFRRGLADESSVVDELDFQLKDISGRRYE